MIIPIILKGKLKDGEVPEMIQLCPLGEWTDHPSGKFKVTKADVAKIIEGFEQEENDIVIDYEHQTLNGTEAPAGGWIKELVNKGDEGLWGKVEWTKRGKGYLEGKEYKYLSPVLLSSYRDDEGWARPSVLHSAALTNKPFIDGMEPIINKFNFTMKEEEEMDKKQLIQMLGLKEGASEEEIMTALSQLKASEAGQGREEGEGDEGGEQTEETQIANSKLLEALDLKDGASQSEVIATIHALKQSNVSGVNAQEFFALKKEIAEQKRDELVKIALSQGKITPAQKEWAEKYALDDPKGFKVFINKAPQVVPVGDKGDDFEYTKASKGQLDEVQTIINKQLGVDEEIFKKYNQED
jgi:phage I-like protein